MVLTLNGLSTSNVTLKSEFEAWFSVFDKIWNVIQVFEQLLFYKTEWWKTNEVAVVFRLIKQMEEMIGKCQKNFQVTYSV